MFQGFYEETIQFLWELRLHNQRPWFQAHKQDYLDYLYNPMKEMGAESAECWSGPQKPAEFAGGPDLSGRPAHSLRRSLQGAPLVYPEYGHRGAALCARLLL